MGPEFYSVEKIGTGRLLVMAKPTAGEWIEEEFGGLAKAGIKQVVSLLEPVESSELGLAEEESLCRANEIAFRSFPIPDRGVPSDPNLFGSLVRELFSDIQNGIDTVVHCRAGIGRTGMIAAGVLICGGYGVEEALHKISAARGIEVPDTQSQIDWLQGKGLQAIQGS